MKPDTIVKSDVVQYFIFRFIAGYKPIGSQPFRFQGSKKAVSVQLTPSSQKLTDMS